MYWPTEANISDLKHSFFMIDNSMIRTAIRKLRVVVFFTILLEDSLELKNHPFAVDAMEQGAG